MRNRTLRKELTESRIELLHPPKNVQVGDRVLILYPAYVAGMVGVVCGREDGQPQKRWLVQIDSENIVVSLKLKEFWALT